MYFEAGIGVVVIYLIFGVLDTFPDFDEKLIDVAFEQLACFFVSWVYDFVFLDVDEYEPDVFDHCED